MMEDDSQTLTLRAFWEMRGIIKPLPVRSIEGITERVLAYYDEHGKRPTASTSKDFRSYDNWLRRHKSSLSKLCDELGIDKKQNRTIESITKMVLAYYEEHGKHPTARTSKDFGSCDNWLHRHHKSSLSKLCVELGLTDARKFNRTLDNVKNEVELYYGKYRKRPSQGTNKKWANINAWLNTNHASSLAQLCDELGIPSRFARNRSVDQVKSEVLRYYQKHGRRPTQRTSKTWMNSDVWLRTRQSSLFDLCNVLGLPGGLILDRTVDVVKDRILEYWQKHGKRPSISLRGEWVGHNAWLTSNHQSSVSRLCDELGIPSGRKTLEGVKERIRDYYHKHGKRPCLKTGRAWVQDNEWLRRHHSSSLRLLCNDLGLPGHRDMLFDRTVKQLREQIQRYYRIHEKRPSNKTNATWRNHDQWLASNGSSLSKLCDELGLPISRKNTRTFDEVTEKLLVYYKKHGKRPVAATSQEWTNDDLWLRARQLSLYKLCKKLVAEGQLPPEAAKLRTR